MNDKPDTSYIILYSGNMAENSKSSRNLKAFCMETTLHGWAYLTYDEKVSPKCAKYETNYLPATYLVPKCFFEIQLCSFSGKILSHFYFCNRFIRFMWAVIVAGSIASACVLVGMRFDEFLS